MKKLGWSRAGCRSPRPSISIRVRPIEMSKCPASSNTVQWGRSGSTGTSCVGMAHSWSVSPRKAASSRESSPASVSIVVSYEPMSTFYHRTGLMSGPCFRLKLAADGDLVKVRQPLLGHAGGDPYADPRQRDTVPGSAQHEHGHPDHRWIRASEHRAEYDRDDRHHRAEEATEGAGEPRAHVSVGGPGGGAADPLLHRVGHGDGEDAAQGQARADPGEAHRHAQESVYRMLGHGREAEGDQR